MIDLEWWGNDSDEIDVFTEEELNRLFPEDRAECSRIWGNQMVAVYFMLLRYSGIRPGEAIGLKWRDWNRHLHGFVIKHSVNAYGKLKSTKTGNIKPMIMNKRLEQELILWNMKTKYSEPNDYVFCYEEKKPLWKATLYYRFQEALKRASTNREGRKLVPYSFRHTFNTRLVQKLPGPKVRLLMGHATEKMTDHYNHPTDEELLTQVQDLRDFV